MKEPEILVVDDEHELADLYAAWISEEHPADTAYTGEEAVEKVNDAIDIVFLDRNLPDMQGSEVLKEIRDRGYEGWVVMLTAMSPTAEIISMEFDAYLSKPVDQSDLLGTISTVQERSQYNEGMREYTATVSKMSALQNSMDEERLKTSPFYRELKAYAEELRDELSGSVGDMDNLVSVEEIDI